MVCGYLIPPWGGFDHPPPSLDRDVVPASRRACRVVPLRRTATDAPPPLSACEQPQGRRKFSAAFLLHCWPREAVSPAPIAIPPPRPHRAGRTGRAGGCGCTGVTQQGTTCTETTQGAAQGTAHRAPWRPDARMAQCTACAAPTGTGHRAQCTTGNNKRCTMHGAQCTWPKPTGFPSPRLPGHTIFYGAATAAAPTTNHPPGATDAVAPATAQESPCLTWRTGGRVRKRHSFE